MSQPIGLLRYTSKFGYPDSIEASRIQRIAAHPEPSETDPKSRISQIDGGWIDVMEEASVLMNRYDATVDAARFGDRVPTFPRSQL